MDEDTERRLIVDVTRTISRIEGQPPKGWLGPWISESSRTPTSSRKQATPTCSIGAWMISRSGSRPATAGGSCRSPILRSSTTSRHRRPQGRASAVCRYDHRQFRGDARTGRTGSAGHGYLIASLYRRPAVPPASSRGGLCNTSIKRETEFGSRPLARSPITRPRSRSDLHRWNRTPPNSSAGRRNIWVKDLIAALERDPDIYLLRSSPSGLLLPDNDWLLMLNSCFV